MLDIVTIGPNGLIGIAGQTAVAIAEEAGGVGEVVLAGLPRGAVTVGTPNLAEKLASTLNGGVGQVACGRNGQTAVPNHKVSVVLVAHVGGHINTHKVVVYVLLNTSFRAVLREVVIKLFLHLGVLGGSGGIDGGHIVAGLGTACDIGDVPYGIGTRGILQWATGEGIGIAQGVTSVGVGLGPVGAVPDGGVEAMGKASVLRLLDILRLKGIVWNGIYQACAVNADSGLQENSHIGVGDIKWHIESILVDGDFGIDEAVGLTVGEGVAPLIGIRQPGDMDALLINRGLERSHRLGLGHTGDTTHIVVVQLIVYD